VALTVERPIAPERASAEASRWAGEPATAVAEAEAHTLLLLRAPARGPLAFRAVAAAAREVEILAGVRRAAALRLGFQYEGMFRQAVIYKGRNRDTTWFSIIDGEWPALKRAYQQWLAPENFDGEGRQRRSLADLIKAA